MNEDPRIGMLRIMQAVVEAQSNGPGTDVTQAVRTEMSDVSEREWQDLVWTLKMSRCLDVTEGPRAEDGPKVIASINGLTTRGLRELQKASTPPRQQHSCPTDGNDGDMGFFGQA